MDRLPNLPVSTITWDYDIFVQQLTDQIKNVIDQKNHSIKNKTSKSIKDSYGGIWYAAFLTFQVKILGSNSRFNLNRLILI